MIPFTPIAGRVLLEPMEPDRTTEAGLILVEDRKPETMGRVVAVAKPETSEAVAYLRDCLSAAANLTADPDLRDTWNAAIAATGSLESEVQVGDVVLFSWQAGQEIQLDDGRYLIMPESDILAVVEDA